MENINKVFRKGGRECNFCKFSPSDPNIFLRSCSGCKSVYYCDANCQKSDWKQHKLCCLSARDSKKIVSQELGIDFSDYADKWRQQHYLAISTLAKLTVNDNLAESHALVLFCDYNTNCGRSKLNFIRVERIESVSLQFLRVTYGDGLMKGMETLCNSTTPTPDTVYFRVLSIIYNKDLPAETAPLCKISYLGHPRGPSTTKLSAAHWIAVINKGDYR